MVQTLPLLVLLGTGQHLHPFQDSDHDAQPYSAAVPAARWRLGMAMMAIRAAM
jgi:hypothetical protein